MVWLTTVCHQKSLKSLRQMTLRLHDSLVQTWTTIAQPLYDLGAISMRMLTKIMHKEELEEREVLPSWFDRTPLYTKT